MRIALRSLVNGLVGIGLVAMFTLSANAQSLSNRPIRLILPYTTGGPVDLSARILVDAIAPLLGVAVVVENRPGANGKIAAEAVARAEPDGHTLMYGGSTQYVMLPLLDKSVSFKPFEDFRMVSIYTKYDIVFMTGASTGIRTMKELLAKMQDPKEDVIPASIAQPPCRALSARSADSPPRADHAAPDPLLHCRAGARFAEIVLTMLYKSGGTVRETRAEQACDGDVRHRPGVAEAA